MFAVFSPVSLLIDVDEEPWELDAHVLSIPADSRARHSRAIFHETVHYWQHLAHGFLVHLTQEEWGRLVAYERQGEMLGPSVLRQEFDRKDSHLNCSARDIHECLARFWDVFVFGPHLLLNLEWKERRRAVLPDFATAYRQARREAGFLEGAWGGEDFATAMLTVAGEYATPFNLVNLTLQDQFSTMCLFPLLGHFSLQTSEPARLFGRFVEEVGPTLSELVKRLAREANVPPWDLLGNTMRALYLSARFKCDLIAREEDGKGLLTGLEAYSQSGLTVHPAYQWAFARRILPAVVRLAESEQAVEAATKHCSGQQTEKLFAAQLLLDYALATPGLPYSRRLLLVGGVLAPPCIRFSNGKIRSLAEIYLRESLRTLKSLQTDRLLSKLVPLLWQSRLEKEEQEITRTCVDLQLRWEAFTKALIAS